MSDELTTVVVVISLGLAILIGITVLDEVGTAAIKAEGGTDGDGYDRVTDSVLLDGNNWVQVRDDYAKGRNETLYDSLGNALRLTGANDSYVETETEIDVPTDQNFTVSTWARVNRSGDAENMTMTALTVQGEAVLAYNGTTGNWTGYYYSDKTRDSYRVDVNAPNQPGNLTRVSLWANGTHLAIYRNTTQGQIVALGDSTADASIGAGNWNGTVEETSVDGHPVTDTQRNELVNDPVSVRPGGDHRARLMYDELSGTSLRALWATGGATASNASLVEGFPGEVLDRADLLGNGDYRWRIEGPEVKPLDGGEVDGAPILWAEYDRSQMAATAMEKIADAMNLANILVLVLVASLLLSATRFRQ